MACLLWNLKVDCHVHKSLPLVPDTRQTIQSVLSDLHLGLTSSLFLQFPHKSPYAFLFSPLCVTSPASLIFDLIMLLIMRSVRLEAPHYAVFSHLLLIPSSVPILKLPPPSYFASFEWPVCASIKNNGKIVVLCVLILESLYGKQENKIPAWMMAGIPWP